MPSVSQSVSQPGAHTCLSQQADELGVDVEMARLSRRFQEALPLPNSFRNLLYSTMSDLGPQTPPQHTVIGFWLVTTVRVKISGSSIVPLNQCYRSKQGILGLGPCD